MKLPDSQRVMAQGLEKVPQAVAQFARADTPANSIEFDGIRDQATLDFPGHAFVIPSAAEGSLLWQGTASGWSKDPSARAPLRGPLSRDDEWLWGAKLVQEELAHLTEWLWTRRPGFLEIVADFGSAS